MKETFNLIKSVMDAGKSVIDTLFKKEKKLTKKEVEDIIEKYHINKPANKEKFFVVLSENQELFYSEEKEELIIRNANSDRRELEKLFLRMLLHEFEKDQVLEWKEAEPIEEAEEVKTTVELDMIQKIKEKHLKLYGN